MDLQDRRHLHLGAPSQLTPEIEAAMKGINNKNLKKKLRTTRRRMLVELTKQGFVLSLGTVHRYIQLLEGRLAVWHVKVLLTQEQMVRRTAFCRFADKGE